MSTATADATVIETHTRAGGIAVRLAGPLDAGQLDRLRAALLRPRPIGCDDVDVDAAGVTAVDEAALAVLIAAGVWAEQTGGRVRWSRLSPALEGELDALAMTGALPEA